VLIRSPGRWAIAVRGPGGDIHTESHVLTEPSAARRRPFVRGPLALAEAVRIGVRGLQVAFRVQTGTAPETSAMLTTFAALGVGFLLVFVAGPALAAGLMDLGWAGAAAVEGLLRVAIFVGYLLVVSRSPSARRLFAYHGDEHKVIAAFESKGALPSVAEAREPSPVHVRCGTSFLTLFMLWAALVYALPGREPLWLGGLVRVALAPLVAGLAFETMRATATGGRRWWARAISWPGRLMQRITTREPTDDQLQVARAALIELADAH
jgi:uncharacterized protein YqhQ